MALCALKRLLSRVSAKMAVQKSRSRERLVTHDALVGLLRRSVEIGHECESAASGAPLAAEERRHDERRAGGGRGKTVNRNTPKS